MDRPKMGFAIPIESWLATDLKEEVDYHLSKERIEAEGFFKWNEIEKLKNAAAANIIAKLLPDVTVVFSNNTPTTEDIDVTFIKHKK
jgi:hypothetical protein